MKELAVNYHEDLCYCCLKHKPNEIYRFQMKHNGPYSRFSGLNNRFQICESCASHEELEELESWFNQDEEALELAELCQIEQAIGDYMNQQSPQARELFYNQTSEDWVMDSQDWIDIELGVAEDDVYTRNGLIPISVLTGFLERFPTCEHVYFHEEAGIQCSTCHRGVMGTPQGTPDGLNFYTQCASCEDYQLREGLDQWESDNSAEPIEVKLYPVDDDEKRTYQLSCPTCQTSHYLLAERIEQGYLMDYQCSCGQRLEFDIKDYVNA